MLANSVYRIISFFDIFEFAPNAFEIWQSIDQKTNLNQVLTILDNGEKLGIANKNGFYFLAGKHILAEKRAQKYIIFNNKLKIAKRAIKIFKILPWINLIALINIIGTHNLDKNGDIDLFIMTKKNRAWMVRFFCAGLAEILDLRPRPGNEKDKLCLSFFIDENDLNLSKLVLNNAHDDLLFLHWITGIQVIFSKNKSFENFKHANQWIANILPNNSFLTNTEPSKNNSSGWKLIDALNNIFFKLQYKILPKEITSLMNLDTRVVVTKYVLKFHTKDNREFLQNEMDRRMNKNIPHF